MDTFGLGSPNCFVVNSSSLVRRLKRSFCQRANRVIALARQPCHSLFLTTLFSLSFTQSPSLFPFFSPSHTLSHFTRLTKCNPLSLSHSLSSHLSVYHHT